MRHFAEKEEKPMNLSNIMTTRLPTVAPTGSINRTINLTEPAL